MWRECCQQTVACDLQWCLARLAPRPGPPGPAPCSCGIVQVAQGQHSVQFCRPRSARDRWCLCSTIDERRGRGGAGPSCAILWRCVVGAEDCVRPRLLRSTRRLCRHVGCGAGAPGPRSALSAACIELVCSGAPATLMRASGMRRKCNGRRLREKTRRLRRS